MQNGFPLVAPPFIADIELYSAAAATEFIGDGPGGFGGP